MGSSRLYGYNDEYYSYALYCMLKKSGKYDVDEYTQAKGYEDIHHQIEAKNKKTGDIYKIKYERGTKQFVIYDKDGNATEYATVENAFDTLNK